MKDEETIQSTNLWPLSKFKFELDLGGGMDKIFFQEVSGLDQERQISEYRPNKKPNLSGVKLPDLNKFQNISLKKGFVPNGNQFYEWYSKASLKNYKKGTINISLLNEKGSPSRRWTLQNAWISKVTPSDLKSVGNEVAMETIEIVHEGPINGD